MWPLKMTSVRNNICRGKGHAELHYRLMITTAKPILAVALVITAKCWKQPCRGSREINCAWNSRSMKQSTARISQGNADPINLCEEKAKHKSANCSTISTKIDNGKILEGNVPEWPWMLGRWKTILIFFWSFSPKGSMFNNNYMLNQRECNLKGYFSFFLIIARGQGNVYILVLYGEGGTLQYLFFFN